MSLKSDGGNVTVEHVKNENNLGVSSKCKRLLQCHAVWWIITTVEYGSQGGNKLFRRFPTEKTWNSNTIMISKIKGSSLV